MLAGLRLLCKLDLDVTMLAAFNVVELDQDVVVLVVLRPWPLTPGHAPRKRLSQSMGRTGHAVNDVNGGDGEAAVVP